MKKARKIKVMAGLLALTVVAGTFAYFSKTMEIQNPFATKKYGGETIEKFTPELNWEPGGEVTKEVQAKNTGDYPLYVRVKFDEVWERGEGENKTTIQSLSSVSEEGGTSKKNAAFFPADIDGTDLENAIKDGKSSVYKNLIGVGTSSDSKWIDGNDGWFYYKTELDAGKMTSQLMNYVTLCKNANMGTYTTKMLYAVVDDTVSADQVTEDAYKATMPSEVGADKVMYQKAVVELDEKNAGLAGANYTLTITTELLQANADAASAAKWSYTPSAASAGN